MTKQSTMSSSNWPLTRLGNLLHEVSRPDNVRADRQYEILGCHWYAKGLYIKEIKPGLDIRAKKLYRVEEGDFVYNRLFAWKGSFALASPDNHGCYVSNEFPCFLVDETQLDRLFLWYYFRRESSWNEALGLSSGSTPTSRNRLKVQHFLSLEIPLPPLEEQRRIVAHIEALAERIAAARGLRRGALEEAEALLAAEEMKIWNDQTLEGAPRLLEVTTFLSRGRQSKQGRSDHYLIKTQHVQMGEYVRTDMTLAPWVAEKVKESAIVRPGDVLIACSAAGCLGRVAFYNDLERTASTDTHIAIARADENKIFPEYLYAYLRSAQGQHQLRRRERGDWKREKIGFRLTELNLKDLREVPIPLPDFGVQKDILQYVEGLHDRVVELKQLQGECASELDALLPSVLDRAFRGAL